MAYLRPNTYFYWGRGTNWGPSLLLLASSDSLLGSQQVLGAEHLFLLAPSFLAPCLGAGLWPGPWLDRLALVISTFHLRVEQPIWREHNRRDVPVGTVAPVTSINRLPRCPR